MIFYPPQLNLRKQQENHKWHFFWVSRPFLPNFHRPVNAFLLFSYLLLSFFKLCLSSAQSWQDGPGNWPFWCQLIISILCFCSWITAVFRRVDLAVPLHFFQTTKGGYEHWQCMEQQYRKINIILLLCQRNVNSIIHLNFILYINLYLSTYEKRISVMQCNKYWRIYINLNICHPFKGNSGNIGFSKDIG